MNPGLLRASNESARRAGRVEHRSEERLAELERQILNLEARVVALEVSIQDDVEQQRDELLSTIVGLIGPEIEFNTSTLWDYRRVDPAFRAALIDAGIASLQKLGRRLSLLPGHRLDSYRFTRTRRHTNAGSFWKVTVVP